MILKALIAIDDSDGTVHIVGWNDAPADELLTQADEDMEESGHTASRYYSVDIAVPEIPRPTVMRLERETYEA